MLQKEINVTCPSHPKPDSGLVGCGETFSQDPDGEGLYDCPHCGMFFSEEGMKGKTDAN